MKYETFSALSVLIILMLGCARHGGTHKAIDTESTGPVAVSGSSLSYSAVQPIFQKRCTPCHPFGNNFASVAALARGGNNSLVFKYAVQRAPKEMPPPNTAQSQAMTPAERQQIAQWLLAGAPETATATEPTGAATQSSAQASNLTSTKPGDRFQVLQQCWSCHGQDGLSTNPNYPNLAGQPHAYIVQQLKKYKNLERIDLSTKQMNQIASAMKDEDIELAAKFFSYFPRPTAGQTNLRALPLQLITTAKNIMWDQGCRFCHSSNSGIIVPEIFGQNEAYLEAQLLNFRSRTRKSLMMENVARDLSLEEIKILSSWLAAGGPSAPTAEKRME